MIKEVNEATSLLNEQRKDWQKPLVVMLPYQETAGGMTGYPEAAGGMWS